MIVVPDPLNPSGFPLCVHTLDTPLPAVAIALMAMGREARGDDTGAVAKWAADLYAAHGHLDGAIQKSKTDAIRVSQQTVAAERAVVMDASEEKR